jgi:micrococcal nuclease
MGKIVKLGFSSRRDYKPDYFSPNADLISFEEPHRRFSGRKRTSARSYTRPTKDANAAFIRLLITLSVATFIAVWGISGYLNDPKQVISSGILRDSANPSDTESAQFGLCHVGGGINCVVDGDTFWYQGKRIRIAEIDTPETHPARCAEEARIGNAATRRLHALLNAGPFHLETTQRNKDNYGRLLRNPTRGGESLGRTLVSEGLARDYGSGRRSWC